MSTLDSPAVYPAPSTLDNGKGGLSINEYATAHGISPKTVRRRIKAGTLAAVLVNGPNGEEYRIPTLDSATVHTPQDQAPESTLPVYPAQGKATLPSDHTPSMYEARWVAALERERRHLEELAAVRVRLADAEGKAGELRQVEAQRDDLLQRLDKAEDAQEQFRILLKNAQKNAHDLAAQLATATAAKALPAPEPEPPPKRGPWWKLWR